MNNNFDLLSIGDATIDTFLVPTETETLCDLDDKSCKICFSYGEKIPVKSMEFSIGGNAANNAIGTTRLGIKSAIVITLGDDAVGKMITERLATEGVDLTYVFKQSGTTSNYSTVINYLGERTIFSYHAPRSYEFPVQLPATPWVYLTSMGETFKPFYNHLLAWLKESPQVKLAFNPGSWQIRGGLESIAEVLKLTHTLFVNREEAEKLTGQSQTDGKEKELLAALVNLGVKNPIVTDGSHGAFAFDGVKYYKVGTLPVDAYERTGAGDAFGSGCLSALIKGQPLSAALLWGTVNSASVIGYTGSQRGLLKEADMQLWLDRAKSSGVEVSEI
jgi:2-dehydro-3-deoxygluconokinase